MKATSHLPSLPASAKEKYIVCARIYIVEYQVVTLPKIDLVFAVGCGNPLPTPLFFIYRVCSLLGVGKRTEYDQGSVLR